MVEFAIVAPIVFAFFFAAFEFCRVAMIRHTADNAVYEACRVGIIPGATATEVRGEAQRILATVGITNATLSVIPSSIERDTQEITVEVLVPLDDNSFVPPKFFGGKVISRQLTLRREGAGV
jgi:Flp pilus assembly protein TadG